MAAEGVGAVSFVFPGDPATRTGGFIYDRIICDRLAARGWDVDRLVLPVVHKMRVVGLVTPDQLQEIRGS